MVDASSALTTTLIGMMGVVIGAIISNYFNQKIAAKTARRDIIFKKKMEYFDRTVSCIEKNLQLYNLSRKQVERNLRKTTVDKVLREMKKKRAKFDIMTSPLYLDPQVFSEGIQQFVNIEKRIFFLFIKLKEGADELVMHALRSSLQDLEKVGNDLILKMRKDLLYK